MTKVRYTIKIKKRKKAKSRKKKKARKSRAKPKRFTDLNDPIPQTLREENAESKKTAIILLLMKGHSLLGTIKSISPLSSATVYEWMEDDEEFREAVNEARQYQIAEVEKSLFDMATEGGRNGPSIPAIIFFLCNRSPDNWKNTQYQKIGLDKIKDVEWSFKASTKEGE